MHRPDGDADTKRGRQGTSGTGFQHRAVPFQSDDMIATHVIATYMIPTHAAGPPSLRSAHARHRRQVAMRLAAHIILDPQVVAQRVDEARLPVPRIVFGIVNGDDVLE